MRSHPNPQGCAGGEPPTPARLAAMVLATVVLAGASCRFGDRGATMPPGAFAPASVAFTANIVAEAATAINVRLSYARSNQTTVLLVDSTASIRQSSTGSFGWSGTRQFPFELDLTRCLLDPLHRPTESSCELVASLRLISSGEFVGLPVTVTLVVRPGSTNIVNQPINLIETGPVALVGPADTREGIGRAAASAGGAARALTITVPAALR